MRPAVGRVEKMDDRDAAHEQGVRDEGTVAAPRDRLRAEEDERSPAGSLFQADHGGGELGGLHIFGEGPKAGIAPGSVGRVPFRVAKTSEDGPMLVADPFRRECRRQSLPIELRVMAGAGNGPDVDDKPDSRGFEDVNELAQGARAVSKRKDGRGSWGRGSRVHGER